MNCPHCGEPLPAGVRFCSRCGKAMPAVQVDLSAPTSLDDGFTEKLVPYKNQCALGAYYTGLFSFICVIGMVLAPLAFVLGVLGLKKLKENPQVHGKWHARFGIVMGVIFTIVHYALLALILMDAVFWTRR